MGVLRFHLLGFPVFVQPGFWLLALLLGSSIRDSAPRIVMTTAVLFVSILLHELGHALAARRYGQQPAITLHMMGGLTSWRPSGPIPRKASILITLAGPAMGLLFATVAVGALYARVAGPGGALEVDDSEITWLFALVAELNLFWSIVNLLPVLPFDGGQVLAAALGPGRRRTTAIVSLVAGLVSAGVLWRGFGLDFAALIMAVAGISQFVTFHRAERARPEAEAAAEELLNRGARALEAGNHSEAAALGRGALALSRDRGRLERAAALTAWAALQLGDVAVAKSLSEQLGDACEVRLKASVLEASGEKVQALDLLRAARSAGNSNTDLAAQLVRLELGAGQIATAAALTAEIAEDVPSSDLREVARRVAPAAPSAAARIFAVLYDRDRGPGDAALALRAWLAAGLDGEARAFLEQRAADAGLAEVVESDALLSTLSKGAG